MSEWRYDVGTWRWRTPTGSYYSAQFRGAAWLAQINRQHTFPERIGRYSTADEAKLACVEHWKAREH